VPQAEVAGAQAVSVGGPAR